MGRSTSILHRIGEINYHRFDVKPGLGDNFSIRLAQRLAEMGDLDLVRIKEVVGKIKTMFFRSHQYHGSTIKRDEYAQALYDDLKRCELLKVPADTADQVLKTTLLEILDTTRLTQAKAIARKTLKGMVDASS